MPAKKVKGEDEVVKLKRLLKEQTEKTKDYMSRLKSSVADQENYRKRVERRLVRQKAKPKKAEAPLIKDPGGFTRKIKVRVNGVDYEHEVEARLLLVHYIREVLGLTGTHIGCDTTNCGACTVIFNGRQIKSCTLFAAQADGADIMTIEGLARDGKLHPLQEAFWEHHGLQCGYCTPGMILAAYGFLQENKDPTEEEIRWGISGNLCRCTGYQNIVKAIKAAAPKMSQAW